MSILFRLEVPGEVAWAMVEQAKAEQPLECCGLLAGVREAKEGAGWTGRVVQRYPLINAAASPTLYESDPRSMFEAMRDMRKQGLEVLAVYHSHPTSAPIPSRTDLERNYSEDVVSLIVSLASDPPAIRAWWLRADGYREAEWEIVPGEDTPGAV